MTRSEVPLVIDSTAAATQEGQSLEATLLRPFMGLRSEGITSNDPVHQMIDHDFLRISYHNKL